MTELPSDAAPAPRRVAPIERPVWLRVGAGLLGGLALLALVAVTEYVAGAFDRGTTRGPDGRLYPFEPFLRAAALTLPTAGALAGLVLPLFRTKLGTGVAALVAMVPVIAMTLWRIYPTWPSFDFWQDLALLACSAAIAVIVALSVRPLVLGEGEADFPDTSHLLDAP